MKNKLSWILKFSIVYIMTIFFTVLLNHSISYAEEETKPKFGPYTCDVSYGKGHCGKNVNWLINKNWELHIYYETFTDGNKNFDHLKDGYMESYDISADGKKTITPWGNYKNNITGIIIHPRVEYIGNNAFRNFRALSMLKIDTDLYAIGEGAFYGCENLKYVNLSRIRKIYTEAFKNCKNLRAVLFDNIVLIGESAFENTHIGLIELPISIIIIGHKAFYSHFLRAIAIPENTPNFNRIKIMAALAATDPEADDYPNVSVYSYTPEVPDCIVEDVDESDTDLFSHIIAPPNEEEPDENILDE